MWTSTVIKEQKEIWFLFEIYPHLMLNDLKIYTFIPWNHYKWTRNRICFLNIINNLQYSVPVELKINYEQHGLPWTKAKTGNLAKLQCAFSSINFSNACSLVIMTYKFNTYCIQIPNFWVLLGIKIVKDSFHKDVL